MPTSTPGSRRAARARWLAAPLALLSALAPGPAARGQAPAPIEVGRFAPPVEPDRPPAGWEALTFPKVSRHTRYTVVEDEGSRGRYVLKADSRAAAAALYRPLDLDPRVHQVLTWRWKVNHALVGADARTRAGDDYAARVYVAFRYDGATATLWERTRYGLYRLAHGRYPPKHTIAYVWDNRLARDTVLDNAYTGRVKMVVVQSGSAMAGRWVEESRNVYEDYRRIFGGEPPHIEGVAVMTDTDDTGESAIAYYDAIAFRSRE